MKDFLRSFVSPQWLKQETVKTLRKEFLSQTIPHLSLPNFLRSDLAESWYEERKHCSYKLTFDHFGTDAFSPSWHQWYEGAVTGRYSLMKREGLVATLLAETPFLSEEFSRYVNGMVGSPVPLVLTEGHHKRMEVGDWVNPHNDHFETRQIAVVYFATKGWKKAYGGGLSIGLREAPSLHRVPTFNELFIMKLSYPFYHAIERIEKNSGNPRYSSVFWFGKKGLGQEKKISS